MLHLTVWLRGTKFLACGAICIGVVTQRGLAQRPDTLGIERAYQLAQKNYPLIHQRALIAKTKEYTLSNAAKGYLPVFSVNGQATYQSAVTSFPFKIPLPGVTLPTYSKDQYRIYAEADQVIYDGGIIKNQQKMAETSQVVQQENLEVELYALYDRVNQLFFGALLLEEQIRQNELLQKDIQNGVDKARALVANGTAFRSSVDELSAQLLQADQAREELLANKTAYLDMLSVFVQQPLGDSMILVKPLAPAVSDTVTRPELLYYDYQKRIYDLQSDLLHAQLRPKLSFFIQGGYGRPGLDVLSNGFETYYLGGLKLNWNFGGLYTLRNQEHLLDLNKQSLDISKETFLFNTRLVQRQQSAEVVKYRKLLQKDDAIIGLRESVKKAAAAQLENGVLSAHDYVTEVNAEDAARQNSILHEMQLLQAQFNYQNTTGNISTTHSINQ